MKFRWQNRFAQALNCTFVYSPVPNASLHHTVKEQAQKKVGERLAQVNHTIKLEAQRLSNINNTAERERIINELLKGNLQGLRDES